jgi:CHASE3 domain sensor protein
MSIRAKLVTAMVVTIAGFAVVVGVSVWGQSRMSDRFDDVQRAADARALALELKFGVTDFNGWQTAYGYDGGRSRPVFLRSVKRFRGTLAQAERELTRPEERRLLERIQAAFADFMRLDVEAYRALQAGQAAEVRRLLLGPELVNFERAAAAAGELADVEDRHASAQERRFEQASDDARRLIVTSAILAALLVVILLVTANDLARMAERTIEQRLPRLPPEDT